MSKSVLGHDPFTRPSPPQKAPAPAAKKRKTGTRKAAKASGKKPKPRKPAPVEFVDEFETDEKEIDRAELLEGADARDSAFHNRLHSSTRFVRPSFYGKKLGEMGMRFHSEEVDSFGFDPAYWDRVEPFFHFLFESYWRIEVEGIEHVPAEGRALLVANHSGTLPYDGAMLKVALEKQHPAGRSLRFLLEDFVFHFPFLGSFMNRIGGVRACQENATRLLQEGHLVAVFPEGIKGIGKLFRDRYKLQRFGRGGFVKLALRTGSPIVPVAVVGAEEIHPMLAKLKWLARPLGLPYFPLTPTFPLLGPLGALPLPSKWRIRFGPPMAYKGTSPADAEDPIRVMDLAEQVRSNIQGMVTDLLKKRGQAFF